MRFIFKDILMATTTKTNSKTLQLIQQYAQRLRTDNPSDYDSILSAVGNARVVLIGEASHGSFSKDCGKKEKIKSNKLVFRYA